MTAAARKAAPAPAIATGRPADTLTVPSSGTAFEFHCSFHGDMGMKGAFYTKAGGTAQ